MAGKTKFNLDKKNLSTSIIREIYKKYWCSPNLKDTTYSSHWRKYISMSSVELHETESKFKISIQTKGFGSYIKNSFMKRILDIPRQRQLKKLLRGIDKENLIALHEILNSMGVLCSFDAVKQVKAIQLIKKNIDLNGKRVAIIGDGFGFAGNFIKKTFPSSKIISINLGKIQIFDCLMTYLETPKSTVNFVGQKNSYSSQADFNFVPAEEIFDTDIKDIEVFINIASFQEMGIPTVKKYFKFMRSQVEANEVVLYCCNRSVKELPAGEIVAFANYGWHTEDKIFFDGPCDWYSHYPQNFPPVWKKFDGEIVHRLAKLKKVIQ